MHPPLQRDWPFTADNLHGPQLEIPVLTSHTFGPQKVGTLQRPSSKAGKVIALLLNPLEAILPPIQLARLLPNEAMTYDVWICRAFANVSSVCVIVTRR